MCGGLFEVGGMLSPGGEEGEGVPGSGGGGGRLPYEPSKGTTRVQGRGLVGRDMRQVASG